MIDGSERKQKKAAFRDRLPVDTDVTPSVDAQDENKSRVETMADLNKTDVMQTPPEAAITRGGSEAKQKTQRPKRSMRKVAAPKLSTSVSASSAATRKTRKIYSEKERGQLLGQIEKSIGRGASIKDATRKAGVSEQTYYHWKKSAASASRGGELKDLLTLEEENARLKKLLAERLRKENAELKKKLGLA
jgi:putative transposase